MSLRPLILKVADATAGAAACLALGAYDYLIKRSPHTVPVPENVRRILVVRPGGMGDMIILLPMLRALAERYPNARIDLVCERRNVPVLELAAARDRALLYDANPLRFLWQLSRRRYDLAIDTEQFHNFSAVFTYLSGAAARIGFKINPRRNVLYTHLRNYAMDRPEGEQFLNLLEPLGVPAEGRTLGGELRRTDIPLSTEEAEALRTVQDMAPVVMIHHGASTRYKRWPASRFADVACGLFHERGLSPVFVGGKQEHDEAEALVRTCRERGCTAYSLAGDRPLAATAAGMRLARLFIAADSGLAHLAVAMGLPTVVLFGPSDALKWGYDDDRHAAVRRSPACAPCFIFGYHKPCRPIACMDAVNVSDVMEACARILPKPSRDDSATEPPSP